MGLDQGGVEMQWVPNVSYSILQGLPRVSAVRVSDSVLWHSQRGGCASLITSLIILPPLHPRDHRSPLHPVPCGEKLQLHGPLWHG